MNTLVTFNPVTVGDDDSLAQVVRLMEEYELHHLPVVDDDFRLLGIISDTDVGRCLAADGTSDEASSRGVDDCRLPTARDVMTRDVVTVGCGLAPLVAVETMLRRHVHSVPVVDQGRLRGIITSRDLLREFAELAPRAARSPVAKGLSPWRPTIDGAAPPEAALKLLETQHCRYLGVCDGLRPLGVLSRRQLGRAWRVGIVGDGDDSSLLVDTVQSVAGLLPALPACIEPMRSFADAAALLHESRCDGLAVVDAGGRVAGMLTIADVLRAISLELARRA